MIPDDMLAGLDPTPEERLAFYEALDEAEAEASGVPYGDGDYGDGEPDGPWHDELRQFREIGAQLDATHGLDAQRLPEDVTDQLERRPSAEAKIARALQRIESGTYVPDPYFRAARDVGGRYASACGELDDLGHCSARYHQAGCGSVTAAAASNGSADEARAFRAVLAGRVSGGDVAAAATQLAAPAPLGGFGWEELLEPPGGDPGSVRARMLAELALDDLPREPREPLPDVSGWRSVLGI